MRKKVNLELDSNVSEMDDFLPEMAELEPVAKMAMRALKDRFNHFTIFIV
jgi:hypothetical protein